jgi:hypothetical protein
MISLGIIGEYIAKIYDEIKARPTYLVDSAVGFRATTICATPPYRREAGSSWRSAIGLACRSVNSSLHSAVRAEPFDFAQDRLVEP